MRPVFFLREALRSVRRNAAPSFAALATVLVTMLMLGIFIPIVQATTGAANDVRQRVLVDVFLKTGATPGARERVRAVIDKTPNVGSVQFVSREQAYAEQKKRNPALYELLGSNPLPDTFRVTPDPPDAAPQLRDALTGADSAIATVKDRQDDTKKILTVTRVVKLTTGGLAVILVIATVLLIANTIRLSLFARRREVEVMKLVGATDGFIRWPFMLEGLILGSLGSLAAIALLAVFKFVVIDAVAGKISPIIAAPKTLPFAVLVAVILAAGAVLSAAGSGLSLRRFLRV